MLEICFSNALKCREIHELIILHAKVIVYCAFNTLPSRLHRLQSFQGCLLGCLVVWGGGLAQSEFSSLIDT